VTTYATTMRDKPTDELLIIVSDRHENAAWWAAAQRELNRRGRWTHTGYHESETARDEYDRAL